MAALKVKINIPNMGLVEGTPVPLTESVERWTELKLDDGTVLRVKPLITNILRLDGKYDPQGNPVYVIQGGSTMVIGSVPDHLRSGGTGGKVQ
ncbi:MAG TPA: hypothetical protein VEH50_09985 [Methylomirabilota bacterium]|nr:hypothetical protein [Methylomirabilota bacterium]